MSNVYDELFNKKTLTLRDKRPYSELFRSVFSPNGGIQGPE